jgi:DNA polymerase III delta prime subunit
VNSVPESDVLFRKLAAAHRAGRLAHAYLILGPAPDAAALAERLLTLLYCREPGSQEPCGRCVGCRLALERKHAALLWIEPHKRGRLITRDQALDVQRHLLQTAPDGGWKCVVLADADRFSPVAANTLLKILEEPPPNCLFLLLTDLPEAILDTIRSRCQALPLPNAGRLTAGEWTGLAEEVFSLTGAGLLGALVRARRVSDALAACRVRIEKEEKALLREREREEHLEGDLREDAEEIAEAQIVARLRVAALGVLAALQRPCRDALRLLAGDPGGDGDPAALRFARGLTVADILRNLQLLEEANRRLAGNMNLDWVFQRLFAEWAAPRDVA